MPSIMLNKADWISSNLGLGKEPAGLDLSQVVREVLDPQLFLLERDRYVQVGADLNPEQGVHVRYAACDLPILRWKEQTGGGPSRGSSCERSRYESCEEMVLIGTSIVDSCRRSSRIKPAIKKKCGNIPSLGSERLLTTKGRAWLAGLRTVLRGEDQHRHRRFLFREASLWRPVAHFE